MTTYGLRDMKTATYATHANKHVYLIDETAENSSSSSSSHYEVSLLEPYCLHQQEKHGAYQRVAAAGDRPCGSADMLRAGAGRLPAPHHERAPLRSKQVRKYEVRIANTRTCREIGCTVQVELPRLEVAM